MRLREPSGEILAFEPNKKLGYSHTSSGATHEIYIDLSTRSGKTNIHLIQINNVDNKDQNTGEKFWKETLKGLKKIAEHKRKPRASA